jgi:hypothetical protein
MQPNELKATACPECDHGPETRPVLGRRDFLRTVGATAAALAAAGVVTRSATAAPAPASSASKPAEGLIRELYATFNDQQKKTLCLPWDHATGSMPTRLGMYNGPINKKIIGVEYTKPQVELLDRIFRSICNGEEGYSRLSRGGKFDNSGDFESIGALVFGKPADGEKFSLVFSGHHLTLRCDGNSESDAAFGGPLYYGHSVDGYSDKNVFFYQTKAVKNVFDSLNEKQRKVAAITAKDMPKQREQAGSVVHHKAPYPGLSIQELTKDQKDLIEKVMRDLVSPYRKEDGDEVMELIKTNGGMEKIHIAFFADQGATDSKPWHFWRLEGPGFVWNYRPLPHVHTFVHIRKQA